MVLNQLTTYNNKMAELGKNLIGYGAAQVFDTSRSVGLYTNLLQKKEKDALAADEKFMKSLSVDPKGLRSVDIPGYTKKYNDFVQWSADNQVDLKNPTKNPLVFQEFQKRKNELLQDVSRSSQAKQKQINSSKTLINGREEFYNSLNVNAINNLSETDIYSKNFDEALNFNLKRDVNAALAKVSVKDLAKQTIFEGTDRVKTTSYSVKEDALSNAVNLHYNQYAIEYGQDFESEDLAKEFIANNLRSRIKSDKATTRKSDGGGLNIGFGGGSTGKVNYNVINLSEQDAAGKYADFGFQGAKEISFGYAKGENRPITFKDGNQTFENVIPKAIVIDPTTGREGFVFYSPGKKLSEAERNDIIAAKMNEIQNSSTTTISDADAKAQAIEYANSIEQGAEFQTSNIPVGEINVQYDFLYDRLREGGVFGVKKSKQTNNKSEQKTDAFGNPI